MQFKASRAIRHATLLRALAVALFAFAPIAPSQVTAQQSRTTAPRYHNPVFARPLPDPMVLKVGTLYYAYGTTMGWEPPDHVFPILRSSDLVHWQYVADAMGSSPTWGSGDWWAPDVVYQHGMFYMFYVGKDLASNLHCIGVATAAKPSGPFIDRAVIGCGDASGQGYIDPAPFVDTDGKAYLYLSVDDPYHSISVIPLKRDLLHAAGPRKELFTISQLWENGPSFTTVEGPFLVKHGATYDLFYSGNDWKHDYAMGYATASSPLGPFKKYRHNPILRGDPQVTGPGGGSLVQGPHGDWWLVYHAWQPTAVEQGSDQRTMRIDPVRWVGDTIQVRGPTVAAEPAP